MKLHATTFHMAERALELKNDLTIIQSRNKLLKDIWLEDDEWEKIEVSSLLIYYILYFENLFNNFNYQELVNLLSQFDIATIELSGQTYPTIVYARVVILGLLVDLNQNQYSYDVYNILSAIRDKIQDYWKQLDQTTHIAAFFDPRYKTIAYHGLSRDKILSPIRDQLPTLVPSNLSNDDKKSIFVQRLSLLNQQKNTNTDELLKYGIQLKQVLIWNH